MFFIIILIFINFLLFCCCCCCYYLLLLLLPLKVAAIDNVERFVLDHVWFYYNKHFITTNTTLSRIHFHINEQIAACRNSIKRNQQQCWQQMFVLQRKKNSIKFFFYLFHVKFVTQKHLVYLHERERETDNQTNRSLDK